MRFGGVRRNAGRIFLSACAAVVLGAWGGALFSVGFFAWFEGHAYSDFAEAVEAWAIVGSLSLIFVIPSVVVVAIPAAILIVAQNFDRRTGATVLFGLATIPIFLAPILIDAATDLRTFGPSLEFIALAAPFAYCAALAMLLVLYWGHSSGRLSSADPAVTP